MKFIHCIMLIFPISALKMMSFQGSVMNAAIPNAYIHNQKTYVYTLSYRISNAIIQWSLISPRISPIFPAQWELSVNPPIVCLLSSCETKK